MSRKREPSKTVIFSFGVDSNDPKYENLIRFLDSIDSGARSYVIRQILNNYINSQTGDPTFALVTGFDANNQVPQSNQAQEVNNADNQVNNQPSQAESVPETVNEIKREEPPKPKKKRPKRDPRLEALKNTFG